jgi:hypothetical protein
VLRLPAENPSQAWVLLTTLEELTGFEEKTGKRRPSGADHEEQQPGLPGRVRPSLGGTAAVNTFFPSAHA